VKWRRWIGELPGLERDVSCRNDEAPEAIPASCCRREAAAVSRGCLPRRGRVNKGVINEVGIPFSRHRVPGRADRER
jgi:hypothetical protein